MIYTDLNGEEAAGEVWSPGPVARSVWVFPADGSDAVAVKLATDKKPNQEFYWNWRGHDPAYRWQFVTVPELPAKDWRDALGVDKGYLPL